MVFLRRFLKTIPSKIDFIYSLVIVIPAYLLKAYRKAGSAKMHRTTKMLVRIGVFPISNHYYEPLFDDRYITKPLDSVRYLPGLELNLNKQLVFLDSLTFAKEIELLNWNDPGGDYSFHNGAFESGDAEFLYQIVRYLKPNVIIEIGSGFSTKIVKQANEANFAIDSILARHICVEPYENPWLDLTDGIQIIRKTIEQFNYDWGSLQKDDLVFIDSSHVIRPQGDVLKLYLEIFPLIPIGVVVHIHDIFTPRDYLHHWINIDKRFWNEQYLVEALLQNSSRYEVLTAVNFLKHENFPKLKSVCPYLTEDREPGSLYVRVIGN